MEDGYDERLNISRGGCIQIGVGFEIEPTRFGKVTQRRSVVRLGMYRCPSVTMDGMQISTDTVPAAKVPFVIVLEVGVFR